MQTFKSSLCQGKEDSGTFQQNLSQFLLRYWTLHMQLWESHQLELFFKRKLKDTAIISYGLSWKSDHIGVAIITKPT